jgi:phage tail protein X
MPMRYEEQIVVRCSKKLKRAVDQFAKKNEANTSEVSRRVLEVAFGIQDEMPMPPGLARIMPDQVEAPGKA